MQHQDNGPPAVSNPPQETQAQEEEEELPKGRKYIATSSEGSITRSRTKASTEEIIDASTEEQEPLSRRGRKYNKDIREQEVAREKETGKQDNLDFLVKSSQESKYLLSAEEERKEKDKALKQSRK